MSMPFDILPSIDFNICTRTRWSDTALKHSVNLIVSIIAICAVYQSSQTPSNALHSKDLTLFISGTLLLYAALNNAARLMQHRLDDLARRVVDSGNKAPSKMPPEQLLVYVTLLVLACAWLTLDLNKFWTFLPNAVALTASAWTAINADRVVNEKAAAASPT